MREVVTMEPLISIIIPVYNVEEYLPQCLDSVCQQIYTNLEVILIDDGSTDSSGMICDAYAEKDPRLVVYHKENEGVASARNAGLQRVSGEYIMFVDSDDRISEDAVEQMWKRSINDNSDLVIARHVNYPCDKRKSDLKWVADCVLSRGAFWSLFGAHIQVSTALWGKLFKRSVLDGIIVPPFDLGEDTWIFPDYISKCDRISMMDSVVYFYNHRLTSLTKSLNENRINQALSAATKMLLCLYEQGYGENAKVWFDNALSWGLRSNNKKNVKEYLTNSLGVGTIKNLLHGQRIKVKLKWLALFVPFIYDIAQVLKTMGVRLYG